MNESALLQPEDMHREIERLMDCEVEFLQTRVFDITRDKEPHWHIRFSRNGYGSEVSVSDAARALSLDKFSRRFLAPIVHAWKMNNRHTA